MREKGVAGASFVESIVRSSVDREPRSMALLFPSCRSLGFDSRFLFVCVLRID